MLRYELKLAPDKTESIDCLPKTCFKSEKAGEVGNQDSSTSGCLSYNYDR